MNSEAKKSASSDNNSGTPNETKGSKMTNKECREEYFKKLRKWLNTVNTYQCYYKKLQENSAKNNRQSKKENTDNVRGVLNIVPIEPVIRLYTFGGIRCQIPSLWKRFAAEFIDFIILSFVKFFFTYFILDSIYDIDFAKYNKILAQDDYTMNYSIVVEVTSELIFLEIAHRIIVCLYEIYWLQSGTLFQGGATIGKIVFDISVVRVDELFNIVGCPNHVIAVTPGSELGWKCATYRTLVKNVCFAFLYPLSFLAGASNQNRCAYDVLCGTIVVEIIQPFKCHASELIPIA